jgi:hypothetical protein
MIRGVHIGYGIFSIPDPDPMIQGSRSGSATLNQYNIAAVLSRVLMISRDVARKKIVSRIF